LEDTCVPKRAHPITSRGERMHQRNGDARVEWIVCGASAPPRRGLTMRATPTGVGSQALDRPVHSMTKRSALVVGPPLELGRARESKSVEKGTVIQRDGVRCVAARERFIEISGVAPDELGVESEFLRADDGLVVAKLTPQRIQRLRHDAPALLVVGVRP